MQHCSAGVCLYSAEFKYNYHTMVDLKMKLTKHLIQAVKDNDLKFLKTLSNTTKLTKFVHRDTGKNLLQFAVLYQSKEVFDYLLAIEDYPLNHKNKKGQTALNLCFDNRRLTNLQCFDQFACELIKKGVSVDCVPLDINETLLHYAIRKNFVQVSKLLMHMGYDVNARNEKGVTPLWLCMYEGYDEIEKTELVEALLYHDADPTVEPCFSIFSFFEHVIQCHYYQLQETLFKYFVDDYTSIDVTFSTLMRLAQDRSPHFCSVVEHTSNVNHLYVDCHPDLFQIDPDYLDILITKFPDAIRQVICEAIKVDQLMGRGESGNRFLENLGLLLESDLRDDVIETINDQLNFRKILVFETDESFAFERISFLLSYGIKIDEYTLNTFYGKFGFGELFKLVVDMEIQPLSCKIGPWDYLYSEPIYSVHFDLQQILDNLSNYRYGCTETQVLKLLEHFSDAKLRELSRAIVPRTNKIDVVAESQPQIPRLVELARNTFHKFLGETFKIETPVQFYKLVNKLPIAPEHMKIITLEKKLY